jgi:flavin-binding protein dodecin
MASAQRHGGTEPMQAAQRTEVLISATSTEGFEDAAREGIARATASLRSTHGVHIKEQRMLFDRDGVVGYQVNLIATFDGEPEAGAEELGVFLEPDEYRRLRETEEELRKLRAPRS